MKATIAHIKACMEGILGDLEGQSDFCRGLKLSIVEEQYQDKHRKTKTRHVLQGGENVNNLSPDQKLIYQTYLSAWLVLNIMKQLGDNPSIPTIFNLMRNPVISNIHDTEFDLLQLMWSQMGDASGRLDETSSRCLEIVAGHLHTLSKQSMDLPLRTLQAALKPVGIPFTLSGAVIQNFNTPAPLADSNTAYNPFIYLLYARLKNILMTRGSASPAPDEEAAETTNFRGIYQRFSEIFQPLQAEIIALIKKERTSHYKEFERILAFEGFEQNIIDWRNQPSNLWLDLFLTNHELSVAKYQKILEAYPFLREHHDQAPEAAPASPSPASAKEPLFMVFESVFRKITNNKDETINWQQIKTQITGKLGENTEAQATVEAIINVFEQAEQDEKSTSPNTSIREFLRLITAYMNEMANRTLDQATITKQKDASIALIEFVETEFNRTAPWFSKGQPNWMKPLLHCLIEQAPTMISLLFGQAALPDQVGVRKEFAEEAGEAELAATQAAIEEEQEAQEEKQEEAAEEPPEALAVAAQKEQEEIAEDRPESEAAVSATRRKRAASLPDSSLASAKKNSPKRRYSDASIRSGSIKPHRNLASEIATKHPRQNPENQLQRIQLIKSAVEEKQKSLSSEEEEIDLSENPTPPQLPILKERRDTLQQLHEEKTRASEDTQQLEKQQDQLKEREVQAAAADAQPKPKNDKEKSSEQKAISPNIPTHKDSQKPSISPLLIIALLSLILGLVAFGLVASQVIAIPAIAITALTAISTALTGLWASAGIAGSAVLLGGFIVIGGCYLVGLGINMGWKSWQRSQRLTFDSSRSSSPRGSLTPSPSSDADARRSSQISNVAPHSLAHLLPMPLIAQINHSPAHKNPYFLLSPVLTSRLFSLNKRISPMTRTRFTWFFSRPLRTAALLTLIFAISLTAIAADQLAQSASNPPPETTLSTSTANPTNTQDTSKTAYNWGSVEVAKRLYQDIVKDPAYLPQRFEHFGRAPNVQASELNLSGQAIDEKQDFTKTIFSQGGNFLLTRFNGAANFTLCRFDGLANFYNTYFGQSADFTWCTFAKNGNFAHAKFRKSAIFYHTFFQESSNFFGVRFFDVADFMRVHFTHQAKFTGSSFYGKTSFFGTNFDENASFNQVKFIGNTNFSQAHFSKNVDFSGAQFSDQLDLSGVHFLGHVDLHGIRLPHYLNLADMRYVRDVIDLTDVRRHGIDERTLLNLLNADIDKVRFSYEHFKLYFPPGTREQEIERVYEEVLHNFKANGYKNSYQQLYIESLQHKYAVNHQWVRNLMHQYWWNYGFAKGRIFLWILVILLLATLINSLFYQDLIKDASEVGFIDEKMEAAEAKRSFLYQFVRKFPRAFIYTTMLFFGGLMGFQRTPMDFRSKKLVVNVYLMLVIATGLICAMFILNFFIHA